MASDPRVEQHLQQRANAAAQIEQQRRKVPLVGRLELPMMRDLRRVLEERDERFAAANQRDHRRGRHEPELRRPAAPRQYRTTTYCVREHNRAVLLDAGGERRADNVVAGKIDADDAWRKARAVSKSLIFSELNDENRVTLDRYKKPLQCENSAQCDAVRGVDNVVESHGHLNIVFIFHMKLNKKAKTNFLLASQRLQKRHLFLSRT
jgi:hypothetical protein